MHWSTGLRCHRGTRRPRLVRVCERVRGGTRDHAALEIGIKANCVVRKGQAFDRSDGEESLGYVSAPVPAHVREEVVFNTDAAHQIGYLWGDVQPWVVDVAGQRAAIDDVVGKRQISNGFVWLRWIWPEPRGHVNAEGRTLLIRRPGILEEIPIHKNIR